VYKAARKEDKKEFCRIILENKLHFQTSPGEIRFCCKNYLRDFFSFPLEYIRVIFLAYCNETGTPVGCLLLTSHKDVTEINVYVKRNHRRRGLAKRMVRKARSFSRTKPIQVHEFSNANSALFKNYPKEQNDSCLIPISKRKAKRA